MLKHGGVRLIKLGLSPDKATLLQSSGPLGLKADQASLSASQDLTCTEHKAVLGAKGRSQKLDGPLFVPDGRE